MVFQVKQLNSPQKNLKLYKLFAFSTHHTQIATLCGKYFPVLGYS